MDTNRRALLQGFTGAALLAPYLALERAMAAETAKAAPAATAMSNEDHMAAMSKVLGPGLWGQEQVAMLLYPKFTALDLVGPHYFFACMWGAKVHLVTTEKDLSPVMSDLGLAISPTMTMADAPKDLDVLFIPGGTEGTLSVMGRTDTIGWVKDRASRAKHITSVCTGSMVLAKAGLLKGKRATSHWVTRETLADFGAIPGRSAGRERWQCPDRRGRLIRSRFRSRARRDAPWQTLCPEPDAASRISSATALPRRYARDNAGRCGPDDG
jgi:cyclohexyl-isocyanide hydratase